MDETNEEEEEKEQKPHVGKQILGAMGGTGSV